jgi:hypothetical protein
MYDHVCMIFSLSPEGFGSPLQGRGRRGAGAFQVSSLSSKASLPPRQPLPASRQKAMHMRHSAKGGAKKSVQVYMDIKIGPRFAGRMVFEVR